MNYILIDHVGTNTNLYRNNIYNNLCFEQNHNIPETNIHKNQITNTINRSQTIRILSIPNNHKGKSKFTPKKDYIEKNNNNKDIPEPKSSVFEEEEVQETLEKGKVCILGKILNEKSIHTSSTQSTLTSIWSTLKT